MHAIHDPTNFWLSWDPTDSEDIRLLQEYVENNGSTAYLPSSTVRNLISLWNYMNLLFKQERPAEQKYNRLYYIMDEQWTKLTAHGAHSPLLCFIHEKGNFSYALHKPHDQKELQGITHHYILYRNHLFIYFI